MEERVKNRLPNEMTWQPRTHRWAVKIGGQVIGEVELVRDGPSTALLRRLRIDPAWQRTAALSRLMECVRQYCEAHGRLHLRLKAGCAPRWMLTALRRQGIPLVGRLDADRRVSWPPDPMFAPHLQTQHVPG